MAAVAAFAAAIAQFACGTDSEGDTDGTSGTATAMMLFGCAYESRLIDSCNNPEGSPWAEGCVDVLTEEACAEATQDSTETVGGCDFTTTYRNVMTTPGMTCPAQETTGPMMNDGAAVGEPCTVLSDCAMGICIPQFYCTLACSSAADCSDEFSSGCCVSEGSLGYCISEEDCAGLCPENSTPMGLPTVCVCDDGFEYDPMTDTCVAV